jgi:hypothetical protein
MGKKLSRSVLWQNETAAQKEDGAFNARSSKEWAKACRVAQHKQ